MYTGKPGTHYMNLPAYTPATAPGIAFWFNADDVSAATSNTWDSRVGSFRATNATSYARPFDSTYASRKGAVFQNDELMTIARADGTGIYETTAFPTNSWFAGVLSINGNSGSTGHIWSTEANAGDFHARWRLLGKSGTDWSMASSAGSASAWNDVNVNSVEISAGQNLQLLNTHVVIMWQLGSSGTLRINGVAYNFDRLLGPKNHLPSGNANSTKIKLGKRWNNTEGLHMNLRHLLHGAASLTTLDMQKIEGALAHDTGIQASLPSDHPYKINAP